MKKTGTTRGPVEDLRYILLPQGKEISVCPDAYVFLYVDEGAVSVYREEQKTVYERGDLVLLTAGVSYRIAGDAKTPDPAGARLLLVYIAAAFLHAHAAATQLSACDSVRNPGEDYPALERLLLECVPLAAQGFGEENCALTGRAWLILGEIRKFGGGQGSGGKLPRQADRVRAISDYIDAHLTEPVTLSSLASAFYMTPQYLSYFFKTNFSVNFSTYLAEKRLAASLRELAGTDLPILEVALNSGFSSAAAYRRSFEKKYRMTPSAYREKHRRSAGKTAGQVLLPEIPEHIRAASVRRNISIDVSKTPEIRERTDLILNVGSVQNLYTDAYRMKLLEINRQFRFTYIRLLEVVSSAFIPMTLPDWAYYYHYVDSMLSFLLAQGLIPFIELSRQQFRFTAGTEESGERWFAARTERWYRLFEAFLDHVCGRWPAEWLSRWKFELWMQPHETAESYVRDFARIRALLDARIPEAALGGPGYQEAFSRVPLEELLAAFGRAGVRPSFFSAYLTCYERVETKEGAQRAETRQAETKQGKTQRMKPVEETSRVQICADGDLPARSIRHIRDRVRALMPGVPFYVTEWTSADIPGLPVAWSRYQAAFLVRTALQLQKVCDMSGYWLLADVERRTGFRQDTHVLYPDGQGLLGGSFLPMAPYYAYRMLHETGSSILSEGPDYILTRKEQHHYQLLAFHYGHFRAMSDPGIRGGEDFDNIYSLFEEDPVTEYRFHLDHLPPGIYRFRRTLLDEYGSILDIRIGEYRHSSISKTEFLLRVRNQTPEERDALAKNSVPEQRTIYTSCDGEILLEAFLPTHTVCLWSLQLEI